MNFVHKSLFCPYKECLKDKSIYNADQIMIVKQQFQMYCTHYSIVFTELLLSLGVDATTVFLYPSIPDGDIHVVTVVYINDLKKYGLFDADFNTYIYLNDEKLPLDPFEIRNAIANKKELNFKHIDIDKKWALVLNGVLFDTYDEWYKVYITKNIFKIAYPLESRTKFSQSDEIKYKIIEPSL